MTIAPQFTVSKVVRHGFILAGLLNPEQSVPAVKASWAEEMLDGLIAELVVEGIFPRDVKTWDLALTPGQDRYPVPSWAFDVVDTAMWRKDSTYPPLSEIPVFPMSRQTYQERQAKGANGLPREYYTDRSLDPLMVTLWPVPDASQAGAVIRFQLHAIKQQSVGQSAPDMERFWTDYLCFALGERLALASGFANQANLLGGRANEKKQLCKAYSNERPNDQMVIAHRTGWRGR